MSQWMQCNWIQQTPTWADSVCSIRTQKPKPAYFPPWNNSGTFEVEREERWKKEGAQKEALRLLLRRAFGFERDAEPLPAVVAAEVRELAAPVVEQYAKRIQIDWEALTELRNVRAELLRIAAMMAEAEDDDDDAIVLMQ